MNLLAIFLTGLFTGGLTCMAVQGGLLSSALLSPGTLNKKNRITTKTFPILAFLAAKIIAYTIFGFLLGLLGERMKISLPMQVLMQSVAIVFMIGSALNMLNIHPIFRYFAITPPRFLYKFLRRLSRDENLFSPMLLGLFTVFIPCGTTQAIMVLSISSASPILGAAIMFSFILGTMPIFFILALLATKLGEKMHGKFVKISAALILLLAIYNLNNTLALGGSDLVAEKVWQKFYCQATFCQPQVLGVGSGNLTNNITINLSNRGYDPNTFSVLAGSQVTLNLVNNNGSGCIQGFTIPKLNIQKIIPLGGNDQITFQAPKETGEIAFMCNMGMFRGKIIVKNG